MNTSPNRDPFQFIKFIFNLCLFVLIIWVLRYATNDFLFSPKMTLQSINEKPLNADQQDKLTRQMNAISQQLKNEGAKPGYLQSIIDSYSTHPPQQPEDFQPKNNSTNKGNQEPAMKVYNGN
jgi:hypothetical protein